MGTKLRLMEWKRIFFLLAIYHKMRHPGAPARNFILILPGLGQRLKQDFMKSCPDVSDEPK